jgi:hypothetical protein
MFSVRFQPLRPTPRDQIALPGELIRVVERNVLGILRHAAALREAGRSLRCGLLPVRYLRAGGTRRG